MNFKILINLILLISISFSQGLTIFGGLNNSSTSWKDEIDWPDGYEELSLSGFNYGMESDLGSIWLGFGINNRGFGLKIPSYGSDENLTYSYNYNYYTLHSILPISISQKMTILGGIQAGFISSNFASVDGGSDNDNDISILPPYVSRLDNGLILGLQYWFSNNIGLRATYYHGLTEFDTYTPAGLGSNRTSSISFVYNINGKPSTGIKFGAGPSAKPGSGGKGGIKKPGPTGSSEIDDFVNSAFELNDNLLALKAKLDGVSNGLKESNEIISEIDNHPDGSLGWISNQLVKGTSKAVNNLKTLNISAGLDGLNPAQKLRNVLQALKSGIVDGKDELKTIPNDLESLANDAKNLISSASSLPQAAKSLGMKAPKALVAIKDATNVLKNIPGEVSAVGNSAKEVAQEIEQFLQNIENLLKG